MISIIFSLYACSKELVSQYTPYLKKLGLTYTQYIVMMVMWESVSITSRDLAAKGEAVKDEALKIPPCIASCVGLNEEEFKMLYILTYKALNNMENVKCKNK